MRRDFVISSLTGAAIGLIVAMIGFMIAVHFALRSVRWEPPLVGYHQPGMMRMFSSVLLPIGSAFDGCYLSPATKSDVPLAAANVTRAFTSWLEGQDNPHLRLGEVVEQNTNVFLVDIVTTDGSGLVERFAVDRHTGATRPIR